MLRIRPLTHTVLLVCAMLVLWLGAPPHSTAQGMSILGEVGEIANALAQVCGENFIEITTEIVNVQAGSVDWGDYDNDGDPDLLISGSIDNTRFGGVTLIYRNDNGALTNIDAGLLGLWRSSVAWGDYDNDADLDVLLTGENTSGGTVTRIYRNNNGVFANIDANLPGVANGSAAWGDYNGDGNLDILLTGETSSNGDRIAKVYVNNGQGDFMDAEASLTGVAFSSVAWGDSNGDGNLDILLTGNDSINEPVAKIYPNTGGNFGVETDLSGVAWGSVAWGDYDNDGDLDILLSGSGPGFVLTAKIYRNDGNNVFVDIGAALAGVADSSATWGDYDNDGDLDLLIAGLSNAISQERISQLYRNDGNDIFTPVEVELAGVRFAAAAWADVDKDGDLDFLLTGQESGDDSATKLYRNNRCIGVYLPVIIK